MAQYGLKHRPHDWSEGDGVEVVEDDAVEEIPDDEVEEIPEDEVEAIGSNYCVSIMRCSFSGAFPYAGSLL